MSYKHIHTYISELNKFILHQLLTKCLFVSASPAAKAVSENVSVLFIFFETYMLCKGVCGDVSGRIQSAHPGSRSRPAVCVEQSIYCFIYYLKFCMFIFLFMFCVFVLCFWAVLRMRHALWTCVGLHEATALVIVAVVLDTSYSGYGGCSSARLLFSTHHWFHLLYYFWFSSHYVFLCRRNFCATEILRVLHLLAGWW